MVKRGCSLGKLKFSVLICALFMHVQMKTAITVGVVGFPNVGKSSLINSLKRTRVANVGSTPGVTKAMQEIHLDKNVKLLDCPGIVFAASGDNEASATLRNCSKIEKLEDPATPGKMDTCGATLCFSVDQLW
jgi:ribosome biogenesis GTPase A